MLSSPSLETSNLSRKRSDITEQLLKAAYNTNQLINQPIDQSINQSSNQQSIEQINNSLNQSIYGNQDGLDGVVEDRPHRVLDVGGSIAGRIRFPVGSNQRLPQF